MSELPLTPLSPPDGLTALGSQDAGVCVDGVCVVPLAATEGRNDESTAATDVLEGGD